MSAARSWAGSAENSQVELAQEVPRAREIAHHVRFGYRAAERGDVVAQRDAGALVFDELAAVVDDAGTHDRIQNLQDLTFELRVEALTQERAECSGKCAADVAFQLLQHLLLFNPAQLPFRRDILARKQVPGGGERPGDFRLAARDRLGIELVYRRDPRAHRLFSLLGRAPVDVSDVLESTHILVRDGADFQIGDGLIAKSDEETGNDQGRTEPDDEIEPVQTRADILEEFSDSAFGGPFSLGEGGDFRHVYICPIE